MFTYLLTREVLRGTSQRLLTGLILSKTVDKADSLREVLIGDISKTVDRANSLQDCRQGGL